MQSAHCPLPAAGCELMWTAAILAGGQARRFGGRDKSALSDLQIRDIGPDEVAPFDPDGRLLTNVSAPGDYQRARRAADGEPRSA